MSLRETYEPRIRQALEDIKEALARKEVVCDTLTASEVPDKIREIELNKYTLTLTCSEFTGGTVTAKLGETVRTATVEGGQAILKLNKSGTWRVEHELGDYVDIVVEESVFVLSGTLQKKRVVFSEGDCSEEKIVVHIDSVTGNNSKENFIQVKKNGTAISAKAQLVGSDIEITEFEFEDGATYTIEYVLSEEVRGSIEVEIIVYKGPARLKEEFLAEGIDEINDKKECKEITAIVFTDEKAPKDVTIYDKSADNNKSVVAWVKDNTLTISSRVKDVKIELFGTTPTGESSYYYSVFREYSSAGERYFKYVTRIDLANVDTSKATNMDSYFELYNLRSIENIDKLNTSMVENMKDMFSAPDLSGELDLSHFDTTRVKTMSQMFATCNLSDVNLKSFNTESVTDMKGMFDYCDNFTNLDLSSFTVKQTTNCKNMFYNCKSLETIDLSNFTITTGSDVSGMFNSCPELKTIYAPEWYKISVTDDKIENGMFYDSSNLPNYNHRYPLISRAKWKENGGYFTNPSEKPS